jgi:preprotein translocase subunit SecG
MLLLAQINYYVLVALVTLFFGVCLILILTVLIQKPAGGGLSGAFGSGAGSGQTAFGAKTGDALTIATIIMFSVFVLGAIGLNYMLRPGSTPAAVPTAGAAPADQAPAGDAEDKAPPATPDDSADQGAQPPADAPAEVPAEPASEPDAQPGEPAPGEPLPGEPK